MQTEVRRGDESGEEMHLLFAEYAMDFAMQAARHAAPGTDELPTFNDFGKRSLWIDFIFARNARALAYRTLVDSGRYGVPFLSDHNPVYALYKL